MEPTAAARVNLLEGDQLRAVAEAFHRSGRQLESVIHGGSMGGTLPDGCRVRIEARHPEQISPGDIAACYQDGVLFAHRLVTIGGTGVTGRFLITQGDGWILCDLPRPISCLLGVVTACDAGSGWQMPPAMADRGWWERWQASAHAAVTRSLLHLHPHLARVYTHRMINLYTLKENLRKRLRGESTG